MKDFPRFVLESDTLGLAGTFEQSQPLKVRLFDLIRSSPTLDRLAVRVDTFVSAHLNPRILGALVEASAREYTQQFDGSFHVCVWPSGDPRTTSIVEEFRQRGISVIEPGAMGVPPLDTPFQVPVDLHPTGEFYHMVAQALVQALDGERDR